MLGEGISVVLPFRQVHQLLPNSATYNGACSGNACQPNYRRAAADNDLVRAWTNAPDSSAWAKQSVTGTHTFTPRPGENEVKIVAAIYTLPNVGAKLLNLTYSITALTVRSASVER